MKLLIKLVSEILYLSEKSQGKFREFKKPLAVATMHYAIQIRGKSGKEERNCQTQGYSVYMLHVQ